MTRKVESGLKSGKNEFNNSMEKSGCIQAVENALIKF